MKNFRIYSNEFKFYSTLNKLFRIFKVSFVERLKVDWGKKPSAEKNMS